MATRKQPLSIHFFDELVEIEVDSKQTIGEVKAVIEQLMNWPAKKVALSKQQGKDSLPDEAQIGSTRHLVGAYKLKGKLFPNFIFGLSS